MRSGGGFANKLRNFMTTFGQPKTSIDGGRSGGSLLYGKDYMIEYENETINFRYDYNAMRNTGSLIAY